MNDFLCTWKTRTGTDVSGKPNFRWCISRLIGISLFTPKDVFLDPTILSIADSINKILTHTAKTELIIDMGI